MKRFSSMFVVAVLILVAVTTVAAAKYNQSPVLETLVEQGQLPAVEERLPENPLVVEALNGIGQYGGTWRLTGGKITNLWYEQLIYKDPYDNAKYKPNLATEWTVSEDQTTFTFKLRKGLKWSDGADYTSEDIMFWYWDWMRNEDLTPSIPAWLTVNETPVEVSAPDEYTVVFKFAAAKPDFLDMISTSFNYEGGINPAPKHYLKQFHPKYTDKAVVDKKIKAAGYETWYQAFEFFTSPVQNRDLPTLYPFIVITKENDSVQVAKRNPYYFKVDKDGNQLPYIDEVKWQQIDEQDVKIMKAMAGEVDLAQISSRTADVPVLKANEQSGNYTTLLNDLAWLNGAGITVNFNQTFVGDEDMAEVLRQKKFRQALSIAMNREEVNEFTAMGLAKVRQSVINDNHPAGDPELSKKYTEYNPDLANKLLDELGYTKRDKEGFRTLPNGKTIMMIVAAPANKGTRVDAATIIKPHWEAVGIKTLVRPEDWSLFRERRAAGEHMINVYGNAGGYNALTGGAGYYYPVTNWCHFAPLYGKNFASDGKEGLAPTGDIKRLLDIYVEGTTTTDPERKIELIRETMEIHIDNLYQLGVIGYSPWPMVRHNRMRNVRDEFITSGWHSPFLDSYQYWIDPSVEI